LPKQKTNQVYLVRHAEKSQAIKDHDPLLTDSGTKRATALFKKLKKTIKRDLQY
jgi:phosphohistidine phosphatase SixA